MMETVFDSPTGPVRVIAARATLEALPVQAPFWPRLADLGAADLPCVSEVAEAGGKVRFVSTAYDVPDFAFAPGLMAANGLIGALIGTMTVRDPDRICLHAAAVERDGRLTVLLGANMAGKSTLSLALAAEGSRFWCDDRLPVDAAGNGMSLALRPKLRLPLPAATPPVFEKFVLRHRGPGEADMIYLDLPAEAVAGWGETRSPGRLLVLDRRIGAPMRLEPVSTAEMVKALVPVTFAPHMSPMVRLERLRRLADSCSCARFSYGDSFRAAGFLAAGGPD